MILPVNDTYRLTADTNSWAIEHKVTNRKVEDGFQWVPFKWYGSLPQAANALAELMLRTSNATTLAEALAEVQIITRTMTDALSVKVAA